MQELTLDPGTGLMQTLVRRSRIQPLSGAGVARMQRSDPCAQKGLFVVVLKPQVAARWFHWGSFDQLSLQASPNPPGLACTVHAFTFQTIALHATVGHTALFQFHIMLSFLSSGGSRTDYRATVLLLTVAGQLWIWKALAPQ